LSSWLPSSSAPPSPPTSSGLQAGWWCCDGVAWWCCDVAAWRRVGATLLCRRRPEMGPIAAL
jgi:hypothetical protein